MTRPALDHIERLKQALAEIRANRAAFSDEVFTEIVLVLLEKLRQRQTLPPHTKQTSDELRLVTVMFIDVKDSTALVQRMGISDWKTIIADVHERISEVVTRWNGQVGQYLGDGVLCFFGAQHSQSRDAQYAVACALEVQQTIQAFAEELQQQKRPVVGIRIGISTGRVVVGMVGDASKQERLALGPATNLASRLQSIATIGEVLIDTTTYRRIRRDFVTQARPPITLKNFDEPVQAYKVLAPRTQPHTQFTTNQINGITIPFVGRDEALAHIHHLCDRARDESTFQVVSVVGELGSGKSRLLQETVHLIKSNFLLLVLSPTYETRHTPHNLLRHFVTTLCNGVPGMAAVVVAHQIETTMSELWPHPDAPKAAAAVGHLAGYDIEPPEGEPVDWVVRWLKGVSEAHTILIVVDNLQWADEQSVALLEHLARELASETGVLLTALRPGYSTSQLNFLEDYENHTRITLDLLSTEALQRVVDAITSQVDGVRESLIQHLIQRAEGNPLFLYEYLTMCFDVGVFAPQEESGWKFDYLLLDTALNTLPDQLIAALQALLDNLPLESRQIAQIAAASGQVFWSGAVDAIHGQENASSLLDMLRVRGMIQEEDESDFAGEAQYAFRYRLFRDVAYEMLPHSQRKSYHSKMAYWLLERIAGNEAYYPLLAAQFHQAEEHGAALYSYFEAAMAAYQSGRFDEVLHLIEQALPIAGQLSRDEALHVVTKLWALRGHALVAIGHYDEGSAASQTALMLLKEIPESQFVDTRISAAHMLGEAYTCLGQFSEAAETLNQAYNQVPQYATSQLVSILQALGVLMIYQGRIMESNTYLRQALTHAQTTGNQRLIVTSQQHMGWVAFERGDLAQALDIFDQMLTMSRENAYTGLEARNLTAIGQAYIALFQPTIAYDVLTEALQLYQQLQQNDPVTEASLGLALLMMGNFDGGQTMIEGAVREGDGDVFVQQQVELIYLFGLTLLDDYETCRERAEQMLYDLADNNPLLQARIKRWLGVALQHQNSPDALEMLYQALESEIVYGGRDTWLCHALIAQYHDDPVERLQQQILAAEAIQMRLDSLATRPELHESFKVHPRVQAVLSAVEG